MLGEINTAVVAASYFLTLIIKLESISTSGNLGVVKNIISEYDLDDENAEAYREKFIAFIDKLISEKKRRERKMIIARISPLTNKVNEMDIPITPEQLEDIYNGTSPEKAVSGLAHDQYEFLRSGLTAPDWRKMYGKGCCV